MKLSVSYYHRAQIHPTTIEVEAERLGDLDELLERARSVITGMPTTTTLGVAS